MGRADDWRNMEYLTGVYGLTWDGEGDVYLTGTEYEGGAQVMYHGPGRIVLKIVSSQDSPTVRIYSSKRSDHVRNLKLWAPAFDGAGIDLDFDDDMAQGRIPGSLEPAPGEKPVLWHPEFLRHLRESDGYDVIRFMGWLNINSIEDFTPVSWDDRSRGDYAGTNLSVIDNEYGRHPVADFHQRIGTPYEWIVDLCNLLGKDMWIQIPHIADEEFPRKLASYLLGREGYPGLRPDIRVWIETSNEIWNGADAYLPQAEYALAVAAEHFGLDPDDLELMGPEHAWGSGYIQGRFLQRFEDSWKTNGGSDDRVINVVAGFQQGPAFNSRMIEAVKEVRETLPEVLAITTYFGGGYDVTDQLHTILPDLPDDEISDWEWTDDDFEDAGDIVRRSLWRNYDSFAVNATLAEENDMHMVCYEGGQHILCFGYADWDDPDNEKFMRFVEAFQRSSWMHDLYLEQWSLWTAAGGRTASLFVDIGSFAVWGYWGAREYIFDDSEKWNAFLEWGDTMAGVRQPGEPIGTAPVLPALEFQGQAGNPFERIIAVESGDGTISIQLLSGELPPGLMFEDLGNGTARLSGTPSADGNYRSIIRALDSDLDPDYGICTIQIDPEGTDTNGILYFTGQLLPTSTDPDFVGRWDPVRDYQTSDVPYCSRTMPFSMSEPLFGDEYLHQEENGSADYSLYSLREGMGYYSHNPYGGWKIRVEENLPASADGPSAYIGFRSQQFESWAGHNETISNTDYHLPSILDICLVWRKDQFLLGNGTYGFGDEAGYATLCMDLTSISDTSNDIRFVVLNRNGSEPGDEATWYISEAMFSSNVLGADSYFQLTEFNNSNEEGKRWAVLGDVPAGTVINWPEAGELNFQSVDFTDIRAIGFFYHGTRSGYHWLFAFNRFFALGELQ